MHYRICDSVRSTHNRDGAIVLDIRHGQIFSLNSVGSLVFEFLRRNSRSEYEIVAHLGREFSISREVAESDVRDFLQLLLIHHLIDRLDDSP